MADIGNCTITVSNLHGLGELEDIDLWNGAAAARGSLYGLALWLEKKNTDNETWSSGLTGAWCVKRKARSRSGT